MKRKLLFLSLFFSLAYVTMAQEGNKISKEESARRWAVSFSAGIVPLPDNKGSINPGAEFYISPSFSVLSDIALQLDKNQDLDSTATNKKYVRYKAEFRFYIGKSHQWATPFLGLQFTKANRQFAVEKKGKYFEGDNKDSAFFYDRAHINSPFFTTTAQFGFTKEIANSIYFDFSAGYGFKFTNTTYSSAINLHKARNNDLINLPKAAYRYTGHHTTSHFTLGFRLYYRF